METLHRLGGMEVDLMGGGLISFFLGGGGGEVIPYWGVIKQKSPDFRSLEVGVSESVRQHVSLHE